MAPSYERVRNSEERRPAKVERWEYLMKKVWAAVWIAFAVSVAKFVDLWHVVSEDFVTGRPEHRLHRGYFKLGLFCFAMWTVVAIYLVVWVKYILKIEEEWEDYAPKSIPFATCLGLVGIISFIVSFWPVWGFLTLPIVFILFMGRLINVFSCTLWARAITAVFLPHMPF